jgi:hypothetical protein
VRNISRFVKLAAATCAVAAVIAPSSALASPAGRDFASLPGSSASDWAVSPGGSIMGTSGTAVLTDTTSGLTVTCTSSSLAGSLKSGTGLPGAGIGTITALDFTSCTVDGLTLSLSSGPVSWSLNAQSYDLATGVTTGTVTGIHFVISSSECSAVIDGTSGTADDGMVKVTYTSNTSTLKILATGGNLHVWDVSGCLGAVSDGDSGTLSDSVRLGKPEAIGKGWTVNPGGNGVTGTLKVVGTKTLPAILNDEMAAAFSVVCEKSAIGINLGKGNVPGPKIGTVTKFTFDDCTLGNAKATLEFQLISGEVDARTYDGKAVTTADILQVNATVSAANCKYTLQGKKKITDGTLPAEFDNNAKTFQIPNDSAATNLALRGITGNNCLGQPRDDFTLSALYSLVPAQTITSP